MGSNDGRSFKEDSKVKKDTPPSNEEDEKFEIIDLDKQEEEEEKRGADDLFEGKSKEKKDSSNSKSFTINSQTSLSFNNPNSKQSSNNTIEDIIKNKPTTNRKKKLTSINEIRQRTSISSEDQQGKKRVTFSVQSNSNSSDLQFSSVNTNQVE